jgi:hypothetical protein
VGHVRNGRRLWCRSKCELRGGNRSWYKGRVLRLCRKQRRIKGWDQGGRLKERRRVRLVRSPRPMGGGMSKLGKLIRGGEEALVVPEGLVSCAH